MLLCFNTCAIDSIVQILLKYCNFYIARNIHAKWVSLNKTKFIFELIVNGIQDGINTQIYKRTFILKLISHIGNLKRQLMASFY